MLFASPWYLLGALGAAIPVLIHLYGRRKARRVLFPSLMLIRATQRERTSLVRLRQMWLMILRAAAILLLSLGLARPTVPWLTTASSPDARTILLLDDSLSMRTRGAGRDRFRVAKDAAEAVARQLPAGSRVTLALASEPSRPHYLDPAALVKTLPGLEPSYRAVDLPEALPEVVEALQGASGSRHWYVFTDLQATSWRQCAAPALDASDRVTVVDCGQAVANHAVAAPVVQEPPALVGRPARLATQVRQYGRAAAPLPVRMTVGSRLAPPQPVTPCKGEAQALFDWLPEQAGPVTLSASLPPDALRGDDTSWQVVDVRSRLSVALLGSPEQTRWVATALHPGPASPLEVTASRSGADVTVAWSLDQPGELARALDAGSGLLLFASGLQQAAADQLLGRNALRLGALRSATEPLHIGSFDVFRPPLQAFANPAAGDLQAPSFREYRELTLPPQSPLRTLATFDNGVPALLEGTSGRGRVIIANCGVTPRQGDLPAQEVFVPLLHRLVGYLAPRPFAGLEEPMAGETRVLPAPAQARAPACSGPGGEQLAVQVQPQGWRLQPQTPGVYRLQWLQSGHSQSALFAVNTDPTESDPARLPVAEVSRRLQPAQTHVVTPAQAATQTQRTPLGLATGLLVLAFLMLLAELLLSQAGSSRSREEG